MKRLIVRPGLTFEEDEMGVDDGPFGSGNIAPPDYTISEANGVMTILLTTDIDEGFIIIAFDVTEYIIPVTDFSMTITEFIPWEYDYPTTLSVRIRQEAIGEISNYNIQPLVVPEDYLQTESGWVELETELIQL